MNHTLSQWTCVPSLAAGAPGPGSINLLAPSIILGNLVGILLLAAGRAAWRLTALAAVLVSVPVIGLAPGQAVAGLVVDGLILVLVVVSWLRARVVPS